MGNAGATFTNVLEIMSNHVAIPFSLFASSLQFFGPEANPASLPLVSNLFLTCPKQPHPSGIPSPFFSSAKTAQVMQRVKKEHLQNVLKETCILKKSLLSYLQILLCVYFKYTFILPSCLHNCSKYVIPHLCDRISLLGFILSNEHRQSIM